MYTDVLKCYKCLQNFTIDKLNPITLNYSLKIVKNILNKQFLFHQNTGKSYFIEKMGFEGDFLFFVVVFFALIFISGCCFVVVDFDSYINIFLAQSRLIITKHSLLYTEQC